MQLIKYPAKKDWPAILSRPVVDATVLEENVKTILQEVKQGGDAAVKKYTLQFDKVNIDQLQVSEDEMALAEKMLSEELKEAIRTAAKNIKMFHEAQLSKNEEVKIMDGIRCWRKMVPIEKIGLYIPGGTAPLFSTILMLGIPATIAGCKDIILCTPPHKKTGIHPAILFAAKLTGIHRVFRVGGVQAIAAMSYGTETIPKVNKIFGPGNQYVTCAKQLVQKEGVAIDLPAGPSEVAVFADSTAEPAFVAADLLSQAEHGADSQVLLVTDHALMAETVMDEIEKQLVSLPRKDIVFGALQNSRLIVVKDRDEAMDMLNEYAPEHLILACYGAEQLAEKVINAGSVFLGHYSPESAGDYASGTNHTLPTNGYAKAYSGVSVDSFVKKITFQSLSKEGLARIGKAIELMAEAEGLQAHANAVKIRLA